ncbi:hypothetical protein BH23BAC4_BH23BAC4_16890 [soil metagenome]
MRKLRLCMAPRPLGARKLTTAHDFHFTQMPQRQLLDFVPARDGFSFANIFAWTAEDLDWLEQRLRVPAALAAIALPALGGRLVGKTAAGAAVGAALAVGGFGSAVVRGFARQRRTFGLCGGMAATVVDRWPSDRVFTADLRRESVRPLLRDRQIETLMTSGGRFVNAWVSSHLQPGGPAPFEATQRELDRVVRSIDNGRPEVLGLAGDTPDPFAQHQVVCFGYEDSDAEGTKLFVYDPNTPGATKHIRLLADDGKKGVWISTDIATGRYLGGGAPLVSRTPGAINRILVVDI